MSLRCSKKRKLIVDHEAEKSLYSSFVSAANAVSTLYSQAIQQQRKASAQASRQTLERVATFLLGSSPGSEVVSKAALLQFLQQEYESIEGGENLPHQFPAPHISVAGSGPPVAEGPEQPHYSAKHVRTGYYAAGSPARRQNSGGGGMEGVEACEVSGPQQPEPQQGYGIGDAPFHPAANFASQLGHHPL